MATSKLAALEQSWQRAEAAVVVARQRPSDRILEQCLVRAEACWQALVAAYQQQAEKRRNRP